MPGQRALGVACCLAIAGCSISDDDSREDDSRAANPPPVASRVAWPELRQRSFRQPAPHAGCRPTPARRVTNEVGLAAGSGPAYPVLGYPASPPAPSAVVRYREGLRVGGAFANKVLWALAPSYRGRVLIRGRSADGGEVRFTAPRQPGERQKTVPDQRLPAARRRDEGWRFFPSAILLRRAGCYDLQLDGATFSRRVRFRAVD